MSVGDGVMSSQMVFVARVYKDADEDIVAERDKSFDVDVGGDDW